MSKDITIPPVAVEAARKAFTDAMLTVPQPDPIAAALRAGIAAWPGMFHHPVRPDEEVCIFLPLPRESA